DARTQLALAHDVVRYAGETIAMVVARDRYVAEDAAARIRVRYEPLPVAVGLDGEREVAGRFGEQVGDVDAALAGAPHVFRWRFEIERSAGMPLEGRAVVARYDAAEDILLVHDS